MINFLPLIIVGLFALLLPQQLYVATLGTTKIFQTIQKGISVSRVEKNNLLRKSPVPGTKECTDSLVSDISLCSFHPPKAPIDIVALKPQPCFLSAPLLPTSGRTFRGSSLSSSSLVSTSTCLVLSSNALFGNSSVDVILTSPLPTTYFSSGYWEVGLLQVLGDTIIVAGGDIIITSLIALNPQAKISIISLTGSVSVLFWSGTIPPSVTARIPTILPFIPFPLSSLVRASLPTISTINLGYIVSPDSKE